MHETQLCLTCLRFIACFTRSTIVFLSYLSFCFTFPPHIFWLRILFVLHAMSSNFFSIPVFFIVLRETLEVTLVVSILFSFIQQLFDSQSLVYRHLRRKIWQGTLIGFSVSVIIGTAVIVVWYTALHNFWNDTEDIFTSVLCGVGGVLMTIMALFMVRTERLEDRWKHRLAKTLQSTSSNPVIRLQQSSFMVIPLLSVLREGIEVLLFVSGVCILF